MKTLKILALNWRDPLHPEAGGAEVHLDHILTYLAKKHQVILVSTKTSKDQEIFQYNGYQVKRIGHPFLFNFLFFFQWKKNLQYENFDIIIDDISKIGLQTPLYIKNTPIISIFHHIHGHTLFQLLSFLPALYVFIMEKIALKTYKNTPMVVVSESTVQELSKIGSFTKTTVLHNGIDDFYLKQRNITKIPFQICAITRFTKAKRLDLALQVFSLIVQKYPQARFYIAGKGKEENYLKNYAKQLGIQESVIFLGFISENDKLALLESSEAMLFTSEKEGWGITAIESSACSTPVFGFEVQGIKDAVKQNVNGILVNFGDVYQLADSLESYFIDSQKEQLQSRAYCYAKNFSWRKMCQEFEILLWNQIIE